MADLFVSNPPEHSGVKIPPPVLYVGIFAVGRLLQQFIPLPGPPEPISGIGGVTFISAGIGLCMWSIGLFRRAQTSVVPIKPSTMLVTSGSYRFTRNPMYLGLLFMYVGIAFRLNVSWALILVPVVIRVVQRLVIDKEEQYLERKFGAEYTDYRSRVRRWL